MTFIMNYLVVQVDWLVEPVNKHGDTFLHLVVRTGNPSYVSRCLREIDDCLWRYKFVRGIPSKTAYMNTKNYAGHTAFQELDGLVTEQIAGDTVSTIGEILVEHGSFVYELEEPSIRERWINHPKGDTKCCLL